MAQLAIGVSEAMRGFIFETMTRALVDVTSLLEDVAFRSIESRLATSAIRAAPMSKTPPEASRALKSRNGASK